MSASIRRPRAFTLIELMLASTIAAVIGLAAASLASAMARQVRQVEEQGDIGARTAIAHEFFHTALDGIGYGWRLEDFDSGDILSGAPGEAHCHDTAAPTICSGGAAPEARLRPLEVCASAGLDLATCAVPNPAAGTVVRADGIRAVVPRDGVSEAVRIMDKNPALVIGTCDNVNIPDPITFDTQGVHATPWAVGDYVLVSGRQHANIGIVSAAFAAENNPDDINALSLSLGPGAGLEVDDDERDGAGNCDAQDSLQNARVIRIRRVLIRLNETARTLELLQMANTGDAASFVPVLTDVEDLQVQLVSAKLEAGASRVCISQGMDGAAARINNVLYNRGNLGGGCPNNEPLARNSDPAANGDDTIMRVVGLRIGLLMGAGAQTVPVARAWKGVFDNAANTIATDRRLRRPLVFYVGLPNASAF